MNREKAKEFNTFSYNGDMDYIKESSVSQRIDAKDILEKEEKFNKMKEAKLCGTCYFYDSNGFCDNAKSLDDCADRDSDRTCDNGQYKYKN